MDSWDHMHKLPKDNWPWPKDNILSWNDDTFCSWWYFLLMLCAKLHQLSTENQPLVPQIGPICWVWMNQQEKALPISSIAATSPCPFPSVTSSTGNAREECKGLQRLHSCVCSLQLPSYSAGKSNSIRGLTCKSSDTDSGIGCSVSSVAGTSSVWMEMSKGMRILNRQPPTTTCYR